ncbi:hypothetical protein EGT74_24000 [Chitinophaga lutea]|uniref:Uncharacterized protein n=1 Tax=Chitinophaga lutea TaxID=2488634 RepID=A0A3N4P9W5_9BACT|nr:hypothetical protein [Chitinophaga lutea]RPE05452.1 hypothetical protein EGT74_24000 [Chitinophaga lutea]
MIPLIENYPQFEVNQVLTKDQLNTLFAYTDEQGRLTRSHLIGVGIVCGLNVVTAANGTSITVTRGCCVTSEGYLAIQDADIVHKFQRPYKVPKDVKYPPLDVNEAQHPIMELLPAAPIGDGTVKPIDNVNNYLNGKVVILFVELSKTANKNCLPNSCDDKGATISVTVRTLLIKKELADLLKTNIPYYTTKNNLPDLRMPRFDVLSTNLRTTDDVVNAYRNILTKTFISDVVAANLTNAVAAFGFLGIPVNDLNTAIQKIKAFPFDGTNKLQLARQYYYQYYYDFISDLIEAYNEIKDRAAPILAACCPDPAWFPRHVFLKEAINPPEPSQYRHYFIPSPVLAKEGQRAEEIVQLFNRLYLMLGSFPEIVAPTILNGNGVLNSDLRVTPSLMGGSLSVKSIPHYYAQTVQGNGKRLFEHWNYKLTKAGRANQNLSYRAVEYPAVADFVKTPLRYDLEPYNFFRIEGHVGKNYKAVLKYLTSVRKSNRLPFDIVAVKTGNKADNVDIASFTAHFDDLETNYLLLRENVQCKGATVLNPITSLSQVTPQIIQALRNITAANYKCEADELEELVAAYKKRLDALKEAFLLSNYAEKHVGLQHKGGVPVGGTFILVYHGDMVAPPPVGGNSNLLTVVEIDAGANAYNKYTVNQQMAKLYNVDAKALQTYTTLVEALNPDDPKTKKIAEDAFMAMMPKNTIGRNPNNRFVRDILAGTTVEVTEGIVFADFFLPYIISNDGTPVQYIIQEAQQPLELIIEDEECKESVNVVTFRINGGIAPYYQNGVEVKSKFTRTFGSNQGGQVTVLDSTNASSSVTVAPKTCEPACDRPCNGITYACKYPMWLAKPADTYQEGAIEVSFAYVTIEDGDSAVIYDEDFTEEMKNALQFKQISNANYDEVITELCNMITEDIMKRLRGTGRVQFEYDIRSGREGTGLLQITSPQCYKVEFSVSLQVNGVFYEYRYTNTGVYITARYKERQFQTRIPKFGCLITDCDDKPLNDPCMADEFDIGTDGNLLVISNPESYKAIYWIVNDAVPAFGIGAQLELEQTLSNPVNVRVIVLSENGCWNYHDITKTMDF